ncbi:hypothetical protein [Propionivibrio sp.]|uniref:hypothetical protein n=1 Tax=Propionivibrio sp. TaxID=2212460 RepID=UPI0025E1216A|nr:hypothetical protein [Propionivibrio sp.]
MVLAFRRAAPRAISRVCQNVLGGTETGVTLLLGTFTLGIGFGSLLCERLSAKQLEIGLVPFGSIGLTVFGLDLAFASPTTLPPIPLSILPCGIPRERYTFCSTFSRWAFSGVLHRPALCADADSLGREPPRAHHRREQHRQCPVHGRRDAGAAAGLGGPMA